MAKLDKNSLYKKITPALFDVVEKQARINFNREKAKLLDDFGQHPVTREIQGGAEASNISDTLGGQENLYSFIGFNSNSNPTEIISEEIKNKTQLRRKKFLLKSGKLYFELNVLVPLKDIYEKTPLPWESGLSWAKGIEEGISGLGSYFRKKGVGRSEGGLQNKTKFRDAEFKPQKYLSTLFANFIKRVKNGR